MTTPNIVPAEFANNSTDYLKAIVDRQGAVRSVKGTVSVPSGTAVDQVIGLVPFNAGARFIIGDKSVHCGNFGAGSTTVNIGIIYESASFTDDFDAFASLSTAPQSGGFVTIDEIEGMTFVAQGNGWLAAQIKGADADATANITFNVLVSYA